MHSLALCAVKKLATPFLLAALLTGSCTQNADRPPAADSAATPAIEAPPAQAVPPVEFEAGKLLLLYGVDTLEGVSLNTADLVRRLGRPDRIDKGAIECGSRFDDLNLAQHEAYSFGATTFEVYKTRAAVVTVDFRNGKFKARLGANLLDRTTTLAQIERLYPRTAQGGGDRLHGSRLHKHETFWVVTVPAGEESEDAWSFKFLNGKLVQLEYFIPC